jgi:hypothetical protein
MYVVVKIGRVAEEICVPPERGAFEVAIKAIAIFHYLIIRIECNTNAVSISIQSIHGDLYLFFSLFPWPFLGICNIMNYLTVCNLA